MCLFSELEEVYLPVGLRDSPVAGADDDWPSNPVAGVLALLTAPVLSEAPSAVAPVPRPELVDAGAPNL